MSTVRPRTVSGMRPTGPLHLGHYFGVLKNWVELQHTEEAYFFVADWHALTSDYADPSNIATNVEEMVKDWVAAGLDPEKCVIFRQSAVKEHAELSLLLSMITPVSCEKNKKDINRWNHDDSCPCLFAEYDDAHGAEYNGSCRADYPLQALSW